jgi:RHS repeat-associated protein
MSDSTGYSVTYTHDAVGRLTGVTNSSGVSVATYTYDAGGQITTKTMSNGTSSAYTYDTNGNTLSVINYSASHAALSEYDCTYDAKNRPITQTTPTGTLSYTYDLDGQLTQVTTPGSSISYAYDANGNRTTAMTGGSAVSYLSNNLVQYQSVNGVGYTYGADGNLISGNGYTYTYNEKNEMLTMVTATDSWGFSYDGLGFRVGSVHNGVATRYLNDLSGYGDVAATLTGTGAFLEHFTYGPELTSMTSVTGAASFDQFDTTGNTTQLTNSSGSVANSYVYLPFGEKTTVMSGVSNPFTYSGRNGATDEGPGLYFIRSRWSNPTLGRFHEQDSNGYPAALNQNRYVGNSPAQYADPTGTTLPAMRTTLVGRVSTTQCLPSFSSRTWQRRTSPTPRPAPSVTPLVSGTVWSQGTSQASSTTAPYTSLDRSPRFLPTKPVPGPLGVCREWSGTREH